MSKKVKSAWGTALVTLIMLSTWVGWQAGRVDYERKLVYGIAADSGRRVGTFMLSKPAAGGTAISIYEGVIIAGAGADMPIMRGHAVR